MTDTSDSNYWGDWDSTKRQDLEAKGVVFNEQGVPLSGLNQAMAEIDPDWAPTGTGSFLASVNPTYATQQSIYESDDYKRFIDQMKTYNPEALEAYGGPELWAMNQRALEAGTSLFAADTIAGATGADTFKTDSTTTTSSNIAGEPGESDVITSSLRRWGFSADEISGLAGWVQGQLQAGVPVESVLLLIYDQPKFQSRFPGMKAAIDAGYGAPSPDDYIMYEDSLRELVDKWLPGETVGNVDTLVTKLMGGNISIQQVRDRLQIAYDEILNAPVDVKSWFMSEYGEAGDGMLASVLLDPNKDFTDLEQVAKEAYTQAAADQILGERITKGVAKNIANLGITQEAQYRQFRDLSRQELLYAEKITEDTDLRIETEGVASAFGVDTGAMNTVEQRIEERGAAFGGGGGAVVGQRGATGFGSANA